MHLTNMLRFALGWAALVLLCGAATGEQEPSFRSRGNLVPVPTLVRDAQGNVVYGLHLADFIVEDDGVPQTAYLDEAVEAEPISLVIAVECGRRAKREFGRMTGLAAMLDPVLSGRQNEAALLVFDSRLNLVQDFTQQADVIETDLKHLDSGDNGAAILDAVAYAAKILERRPEGRQRVLLLISETRDHGSHFARIDDAVRWVGVSHTLVYALPFSPYISQQLDTARGANRDEWGPGMDIIEKLAAARQAMRKNSAKALASMTGGEYELFSTRRGFESDMLRFANHLNSRYRLSFEPKDPHPGWHRIQVRLKATASEQGLLFRSTYWVAGPEP
ncbi:MAG: VWA domain-containing protein [Terriglobales bacterium]